MPLPEESVEDAAAPAEHGPLHLMDVGAPVLGLAEGDLAVAGAVLRVPDKHLPVVLDPALAAQDVVNAGRYLVPLKVVPKPGQAHIDRPHRHNLQGFAPELVLPLHILPEDEVLGFRMARRDGGVVGDLSDRVQLP